MLKKIGWHAGQPVYLGTVSDPLTGEFGISVAWWSRTRAEWRQRSLGSSPFWLNGLPRPTVRLKYEHDSGLFEEMGVLPIRIFHGKGGEPRSARWLLEARRDGGDDKIMLLEMSRIREWAS